MVEFKQRKQRNFEDLRTLDDILQLLSDEEFNRRLGLKYTLDKTGVEVNEILDDKSVMLVTDPDFVPENDRIIVYGLLDRYVEVDLNVDEVLGPGYFKCSVVTARKAKKGRRDLRFKVSPEKVVATNFRVSKHTIELSNFRIPTSIKVIIDQFESQVSKKADIVKVNVFEDKDPVFNTIRKTGNTLYIEDLGDPGSLNPLTEEFIDLKEILGDETEKYRKRMLERGYKSVIISPVIYITEDERSIPFAYIQLISKNEILTLDKVIEVKDLSFKLVDMIRDANTVMVTAHQQLVDISKGGAKIRITDDNLKKYLVRTKGFVFDIVFKLQAPITIYGEIKFTYYDDSGNLYAGVDFAGNSSRKDEMKRFYSVIQPMEMEYKSRLLREMKQKRQHG